MIEGINIRCNVGGVEVLRSPRIVLTLRRRAVVSTCEVDIPDADGSVQVSLAKNRQCVCASGTGAKAAPGTTGPAR